MNAKTHILIPVIFLVAGLLIGGGIGIIAFCPDTGKAIIKQLDKDSEKVAEIKESSQARQVKNEKIKVIIKRVPDTSGCNRVPSPELRNVLLNTLNPARSAPD